MRNLIEELCRKENNGGGVLPDETADALLPVVQVVERLGADCRRAREGGRMVLRQAASTKQAAAPRGWQERVHAAATNKAIKPSASRDGEAYRGRRACW